MALDRNFFRAALDLTGVILAAALLVTLTVSPTRAETARKASHLVPSGKGWGVERDNSPFAVVTGNGIGWHGGPVMHNTANVYFIWYGNWTTGPRPSDSQSTVSLLGKLFGSGGIGGSGYELINSTYGDSTGNVSGNILLTNSTFDAYSLGKRLGDSKVQAVVSNAIKSGKLPKDANGIYFVLTSSDVAETSGFCSRYCGWHTRANLLSTDIKYAFVGNPDRCPSACEMQTVSPNGYSGADGMASVMAHEAEEMLTDPDLNAWYDSKGNENADKCAWKFGPTIGTIGNGAYNQTFANGYHWLIQMNWENARGGGCDQKLGGTFYTQ
jgi:Phosphate-induced protein 1 conserved region